MLIYQSVYALRATPDTLHSNCLRVAAPRLLAKPNGAFDASKFAAWSAWLIADGTITLPIAGSAQFMGKAYGPGVNALPGA